MDPSVVTDAIDRVLLEVQRIVQAFVDILHAASSWIETIEMYLPAFLIPVTDFVQAALALLGDLVR